MEPGRLIIDFQTTENEDEQVRCSFGNSPTVTYMRGGQTFLRIDGLLGKPRELSDYIIELITHYHTDHVTRSVVEQCLREGSFSRIIGPRPLLNQSRERVFSMLSEKEGNTTDDNDGNETPVIDITPNGKAADRNFSTTIGDFYYSSLDVNEDLTVEMVKYQKPRNVNNDGLVFRITHKRVSYLLFGDFDNPEGINGLLDIFAAYDQRCDIIKWPHHAHRFANNEKTDDIIRRMNEVIDPFFIIWEPYPTQKGFPEYIERFDFLEKFLCSEEMEILVISLGEGSSIEHFFPIV